MKKMDRDPGAKKPGKQGKSSPKGDDNDLAALETRVSDYLNKVKGDQSLGVFAARLGIPKGSLARYLNKEQSMTLSTLQKIAAALGVKSTSILAASKK